MNDVKDPDNKEDAEKPRELLLEVYATIDENGNRKIRWEYGDIHTYIISGVLDDIKHELVEERENHKGLI